MGMLKAILVTVAGGLLLAVILLCVNAAWNYYAVIEYSIQGVTHPWYSTGTDYLTITLKEGNDGNLPVEPISKIFVVNATIVGVFVQSAAQHDVGDNQYNTTVATISNVFIWGGQTMFDLANINIKPDKGALSFSVSAVVSLPSDFFHPKNSVIRKLPTELVYVETIENLYSLSH